MMKDAVPIVTVSPRRTTFGARKSPRMRLSGVLCLFAFVLCTAPLQARGQSSSSFGDVLNDIGKGVDAILHQQQESAEPRQNPQTHPTPSPPAGNQATQRISRFHVLNTQRRLNALGYDVGPPDGVAGATTRAAVRQFQRDSGLPVTGEITSELIAALTQASQNISTGPVPVPRATGGTSAHVPSPIMRGPDTAAQPSPRVGGSSTKQTERTRQIVEKARDVMVRIAKANARGKGCHPDDSNRIIMDPQIQPRSVLYDLREKDRVISKETESALRKLYDQTHEKVRKGMEYEGGYPRCEISPEVTKKEIDRAIADLNAIVNAERIAKKKRRHEQAMKNMPSNLPPIPPKSEYVFDIQKIQNPKAREIVQRYYDNCNDRSNIMLRKYFDCACLSELLTEALFSGRISANRDAASISFEVGQSVSPAKSCVNDYRAYMTQYEGCYQTNKVRSTVIDPVRFCQCTAGKFVEFFKNAPGLNLRLISNANTAALGYCRKIFPRG